MNILLTFNKDYLMPARILIRSLLENNNGEITIFILHYSLSNQEQKVLKSDIEASGNANAVFILAEKRIHFENPSCPWISDDTYLRLMAQELLPQDVKRYLYIDADTVVLDNLEEFYNQDLGDNLVAALPHIFKRHKKPDPIAGNDIPFSRDSIYFLANVILVDLESVRKEVDPSVYFRLLDRMGERLRGKDQDVLNIVFEGRVKPIDINYNTSTNDMTSLDGVKILHYGGNYKPWKYCYDLPGADVFWDYAARFTEYETLRDGMLTAQAQFKADRELGNAAGFVQKRFNEREEKIFADAAQVLAEPASTVSMDCKVCLKDEVDIIATAGDTIVVPYGELLNCYYGFFRVNAIGEYIVKMLKVPITGQKIAGSLSEASGLTLAKSEECTQLVLNRLNRFRLLNTIN